MSSTSINRLKEIEKEIKEAVANSTAKENKQSIINGICDSVYWINTYQLIESRRDELKTLGFEEKDGDNTHFIEDIEKFSAKLTAHVSKLKHSSNDSIIATDAVDLNNINGSGYYTVNASNASANNLSVFNPNNNVLSNGNNYLQGNIPSHVHLLVDSKTAAAADGLYILNNIYATTRKELLFFYFNTNTFYSIPLPVQLQTSYLGFSSMFSLNDDLYLVTNNSDYNESIVHKYSKKTDTWDEVIDCNSISPSFHGRNIVFTGGVIKNYYHLGVLLNDALGNKTKVCFVNEQDIKGNRGTTLTSSYEINANVLHQGNVTQLLLDKNFVPTFYLADTSNQGIEILELTDIHYKKFTGYDPSLHGTFFGTCSISYYDETLSIYNNSNELYVLSTNSSVPMKIERVPNPSGTKSLTSMSGDRLGNIYLLSNSSNIEIVKFDTRLNGYFKIN